jgi:flavin-binding protein dodecin
MSEHVYKTVQIVGSSPSGVTEAIDTAIAKACQTLRHVEWFEVEEVRGYVENGAVAHYQVSLNLGFRLE